MSVDASDQSADASKLERRKLEIDEAKLTLEKRKLEIDGAKYALDSSNSMLEKYRTFRSYIEHEDKLHGERLDRTLLVHGFLLASYGLLVQARISGVKCLGSAQECATVVAPYIKVVILLTSLMLPVIAAMGILTTMAAAWGVWAAEKSVESLSEVWKEYDPEHSALENLGLPQLTAGGHPKISKGGERSAPIMLWSLLFLWGLVFVLSVYGAVGHLPSVNDRLGLEDLLQLLAGTPAKPQ